MKKLGRAIRLGKGIDFTVEGLMDRRGNPVAFSFVDDPLNSQGKIETRGFFVVKTYSPDAEEKANENVAKLVAWTQNYPLLFKSSPRVNAV